MTDEQIIKALECCTSITEIGCELCPYSSTVNCFLRSTQDALDLINRQKAEIENLKEAYAVYEETTGLKQVRSDAIRKFAERLKLYLFIERGGISTISGKDIDNLVKEMTEEQP
jgi:hypothetical protein